MPKWWLPVVRAQHITRGSWAHAVGGESTCAKRSPLAWPHSKLDCPSTSSSVAVTVGASGAESSANRSPMQSRLSSPSASTASVGSEAVRPACSQAGRAGSPWEGQAAVPCSTLLTKAYLSALVLHISVVLRGCKDQPCMSQLDPTLAVHTHKAFGPFCFDQNILNLQHCTHITDTGCLKQHHNPQQPSHKQTTSGAVSSPHLSSLWGSPIRCRPCSLLVSLLSLTCPSLAVCCCGC